MSIGIPWLFNEVQSYNGLGKGDLQPILEVMAIAPPPPQPACIYNGWNVIPAKSSQLGKPDLLNNLVIHSTTMQFT